MAKHAKETPQLLVRKVLRDFQAPNLVGGCTDCAYGYAVNIPFHRCPLPVLVRHAFTLIGIPYHTYIKKGSWIVPFSYKTYCCWIIHDRFRVKLGISGVLDEAVAKALVSEIERKLIAAVKIVEGLLKQNADAIVKAGSVTILNQYYQLRDAYDYFRDRARHPEIAENYNENTENPIAKAVSDLMRQGRMAQIARYDLVAAISAFMSLMEHELVLILAFCDFDPSEEDLRDILGSRWGVKWRRVLGEANPDVLRLRQQLTHIVERWRNTFTHGGFEKKNSASMYLQYAELGALPAGLSKINESVLHCTHPEVEMTVEAVFALFDRIDNYLGERFPAAMEWIRSGLDVSFDETFRSELQESLTVNGNVTEMIKKYEHYQSMLDNMEF